MATVFEKEARRWTYEEYYRLDDEQRYEIIDGNIIYTWDARKTGKGRIPVKEFLTKQGRFDHLQEEHFTHIQKMVDEMWDEWEMPGVAPIKGILKARI